MTERPLRILKVHAADVGGGYGTGGDLVVWNLFNEYRRRGHRSWLAVRWKRSGDPDVLLLPHGVPANPWSRMWNGLSDRIAPMKGKVRGTDVLRSLFHDIGHPSHRLNAWQGVDDFDFPGTWDLLKLLPETPDLVHLYDLQHGFFDLRALPWISQKLPTFLTLDDAWYLSGHCVHSVPFYQFECERWRTGCGHCPDLSLPASIPHDATAYNWERKRRIFSESRLYIATPSRWLMRKVEQSILAAAAEDFRVVPNGLDLTVFRPGDKAQARRDLGLPPEGKVLLFAATGISRGLWKDFATMREAVSKVAARSPLKGAVFLVLGEEGADIREGEATIRFVPFQSDRGLVARYFQAADVYLHAAIADTYPGSVAEALACGTPVIGTDTGGIPEMVTQGSNGFLVPRADSSAMADRVEQLLMDDDLRAKMGVRAAVRAQREFGLDHQVEAYLRWYAEVCDAWDGDTRAG